MLLTQKIKEKNSNNNSVTIITKNSDIHVIFCILYSRSASFRGVKQGYPRLESADSKSLYIREVAKWRAELLDSVNEHFGAVILKTETLYRLR